MVWPDLAIVEPLHFQIQRFWRIDRRKDVFDKSRIEDNRRNSSLVPSRLPNSVICFFLHYWPDELQQMINYRKWSSPVLCSARKPTLEFFIDSVWLWNTTPQEPFARCWGRGLEIRTNILSQQQSTSSRNSKTGDALTPVTRRYRLTGGNLSKSRVNGVSVCMR